MSGRQKGGKGGSPPKDKETGLPKKYVPRGLSKADKAKQVKSIREGRDRPKLKSAPKPKRSSLVVRFEKKYGVPITDDTSILTKTLLESKVLMLYYVRAEVRIIQQGADPTCQQSSGHEQD
jgi:hypothetical protein